MHGPSAVWGSVLFALLAVAVGVALAAEATARTTTTRTAAVTASRTALANAVTAGAGGSALMRPMLGSDVLYALGVAVMRSWWALFLALRAAEFAANAEFGFGVVFVDNVVWADVVGWCLVLFGVESGALDDEVGGGVGGGCCECGAG